MISDKDIHQLKEIFPTKKEFGALETKVDHFETRFDGLQEQVGDLKVDMREMNNKMDLFLEKMDYFVGSVRTLETENAVGAVILSRHTHQIESLANHAGMKLAI